MRTIATLFGGIEGVGVGARAAGYTHLWGIEWSARLAAVAEMNGFRSIVANVCAVDYATLAKPYHLHASPVCKNASVAKTDGEESREDLETAQAVCRAIVALTPHVFTLENVRGYAKFAAFRAIVATLKANGYGVAWNILNAVDYGVPQTRERLILRAVRGQERPLLPVATHARADRITPLFDERLPWIGWYEAIEDLLPTLPNSAFAPWQLARLPVEMRTTTLVGAGGYDNTSAGTTPGKWKAWLVDGDNARADTGMPTLRAFDAPAMTLRGTRVSPPRALLVHSTDQRSMPTRDADDPAFTVMADSFDASHQPGGRPRAWLNAGRVVQMTPRALACFQSFPDSYQLPGQKGLACEGIGNAVPPLLAQRLIECNDPGAA